MNERLKSLRGGGGVFQTEASEGEAFDSFATDSRWVRCPERGRLR